MNIGLELIYIFSQKQPIVDINVVIDFQSSRLIEPSDTDTFNQLGLYRYADSSTEWLPCKIEFKFLAKANLQASKRKGVEIINYEEVDGFGVTFEKFPEGKSTIM